MYVYVCMYGYVCVCAAVDSIRKVVTSSIGNIEIPTQKSQQNGLSLYLLVQVWAAAGICVCVSECRLCASNNNNNSTHTHTSQCKRICTWKAEIRSVV